MRCFVMIIGCYRIFILIYDDQYEIENGKKKNGVLYIGEWYIEIKGKGK